MPTLTRRSSEQSATSTTGGSALELADFGSNRERTDEVEAEAGPKPSWFEEVMSLANVATDKVWAEEETAAEGVAATSETTAGETAETTADAAPAGVFATTPDTASYEPKRKMGKVYAAHERRLADGIEIKLGLREKDLDAFVAHYEKHKARYESVSAKVNIPPKLIAALHWRESTGSFNHYLHQGDPIGKPSRNVPRGVLFYDWESAAIDALSDKAHIRDEIGITRDTTDTAAIASFAEAYNGLGYHNKGRPSPYVYAGTAEYSRGKYVADGKYDANHVDMQLGVLPMVGALGGLDAPITEATRASEWAKVAGGTVVLKVGSKGLAVEALQERLTRAGFETDIDGDFGPGTRRMIVDWQRSQGLKPDGVVGKNTAAKLG